MPGLLRTLRQLLRSARTHGDEELEQLRQATQALKQDVDLLRANQEKQRLQEESLVLTQLRKTVQALQAEGSAIDDQKLAVEKAFDALSERAQGEVLKAAQSQAEHRTDALLQAVDMDQFVRGAPLEECVRPGHKLPEKLAATLKSMDK
ncbi:hypothetical protein CVIRNUC_003065 [Coccomyxa viridis]|uniref:Uncharacterized protein n=1 Tax=Coccomyxa viridis TaxID=1274662 RepID=A0AAV1I079_9CHLO|nr:hypothetical protein CVIRNUC_003065 [Coccomyxa viridis]